MPVLHTRLVADIFGGLAAGFDAPQIHIGHPGVFPDDGAGLAGSNTLQALCLPLLWRGDVHVLLPPVCATAPERAVKAAKRKKAYTHTAARAENAV